MRTTRNRVVLALSLVVAALATPGVASADGDKPRVLVMPMERHQGVSALVPNKVDEYFRTILQMNQKVVLVPPTELGKQEAAPKPKAQETDPTLVKADKELWKAKDLAEKGRWKKANKSFQKAMKLYEKRFDVLVDFDKYVDAALGVSLSYFGMGYDDNGEDALARVVQLRPTTVLDKRKVPKEAMQALQRLNMLYARPLGGEVRVTSIPEGADVFVDGISQGLTPITLPRMLAGKHVVRVVKAGHKPWAKVVTASEKNATLDARLQPDASAVAQVSAKPTASGMASLKEAGRTGNFQPALAYAKTLAEGNGLDAILWTYMRQTPEEYDLAVFMYDPTVGHVAEIEWLKLDPELSTMQVRLLELEERLLQSLAVFPRSRIVKARSKIYEEPPAPAVAVLPPQPVVVQPAPGPGKPAPTVAVAPKPRPTVVPPTGTKPRPTVVAPPGTKPTPAVVAAPGTPPSVVRNPNVDDGTGGLGAYGGETGASGTPEPWVQETASDDSEWYEQWWVWVIATGVVAGATTAAILVTDDGGQESGFRTTVSWGGQ